MRFYSSDIWCRGSLGFAALTFLSFNLPRAGDAFASAYGPLGYESDWEHGPEAGQPVNVIYLQGNGVYRLNICGAYKGQVIFVINDSSKNKEIAVARTPDHPYITLQPYRTAVLISNGQFNLYGKYYVSTFHPAAGFGY